MTAVVTFTPNPALDLLTHIDRVSPTHKMRCSAVIKHPGGGGVNVARVLHRFGIGVTAVYPSGGVIGQAHHRLLHAEGVRSHVIPWMPKRVRVFPCMKPKVVRTSALCCPARN